jgi:hypothetical protein
MKRSILLFGLAFACTGCTSLALERHSLGQATSAESIRYREVLANLAMVANEPSALPAYSSIFSGTLNVTDAAQLGSTTIWQAGLANKSGFFSEGLAPQLSRTVIQNWSLDPILVPEKLEAMRAACQWIIYGSGMISLHDMSLLADPDRDPSPGRHFNVQTRLEQMPLGWIHRGNLEDVPLRAMYKAHYKTAWVWVMPEGMNGLTDFTLIMQDIARVQSNSPTLFAVPPGTSFFAFQTSDWISPAGKRFYVQAIVSVDINGNLISDLPYFPMRTDDVGSESSLRSQINAAGITP